MRFLRWSLAALLAFGATAQEQTPGQSAEFRTTVSVVVAPVAVMDKDGSYVNGLQPQQFRLFDNGKEQDIRVDVSFVPMSLVVAIQANSAVEAVLPQIQKIGSLIEPLVIGEQGEAAILAFDHRLQLLQDFTSDPNKITDSIKKIKPGSSSSRMIDAVGESIRLLRSRPSDRRRILLLISEARDNSSEGRVGSVLADAQVSNVSTYSVNISRFITTLTGRTQQPRPDPIPPAARPLPPNVPATPNAVAQITGNQGGSANFIPLMVEIFKATKAIFVDNPIEVFTKGTGGREFSFIKQKGLEEAISAVGEELHSQYMVSYNPNNKEEGGFHEIDVKVNRPEVKVRTRPGYWLGSLR